VASSRKLARHWSLAEKPGASLKLGQFACNRLNHPSPVVLGPTASSKARLRLESGAADVRSSVVVQHGTIDAHPELQVEADIQPPVV
jgi:hypothetical protein